MPRSREHASEVEELLEPDLEAGEPVEPDKQSKPRLWPGLVTLGYCLAHLLIGPALILVNKHIMNELAFDFPMAVSGLGQVASAAGSYVCVHVLKSHTLEHKQLQPQVRRSMWAVGAASAGTLMAGNAVYMYLSVSFIQMLKAFTPAVILPMLVLFSVEVPTPRVCLSVLCICICTAGAGRGELNFNVVGVGVMLISNTCEGAKLVLIQKLMANHRFGAMEGLYRMAPICSLWLWGAAVVVELPRMVREGHLQVLLPHWWLFLLSGVLGFGINIVTMLVIQRTSAITLKTMATARNAGLVVFSVFFLGETVGSSQMAFYALSLVAFMAYNYFKMNKL